MSQTRENVPGLYLEDLHVGQRFVSGTHNMDEARIKQFAREFDPQPFHLDEAAAKASVFGGLAASGWHTAAIAMRLLSMAVCLWATASLVWEAIWHGPNRMDSEWSPYGRRSGVQTATVCGVTSSPLR